MKKATKAAWIRLAYILPLNVMGFLAGWQIGEWIHR